MRKHIIAVLVTAATLYIFLIALSYAVVLSITYFFEIAEQRRSHFLSSSTIHFVWAMLLVLYVSNMSENNHLNVFRSKVAVAGVLTSLLCSLYLGAADPIAYYRYAHLSMLAGLVLFMYQYRILFKRHFLQTRR